MQKEERKRQRHEAIWKEWKKLLRSLVVYVKFRLPLRKTRSIDTIKSFMEVSARPYMLRRTVKNFVESVLMVQRALRHQAHIFRTLQKRILQPYVWATETQLLCDAFRMRRAEAAARIEAYMEDMKLKEWETGSEHWKILKAFEAVVINMLCFSHVFPLLSYPRGFEVE